MLFKDVLLSLENQKGTIAVQYLDGISALLVLNGTSLNSVNALLALSHLEIHRTE